MLGEHLSSYHTEKHQNLKKPLSKKKSTGRSNAITVSAHMVFGVFKNWIEKFFLRLEVKHL